MTQTLEEFIVEFIWSSLGILTQAKIFFDWIEVIHINHECNFRRIAIYFWLKNIDLFMK